MHFAAGLRCFNTDSALTYLNFDLISSLSALVRTFVRLLVRTASNAKIFTSSAGSATWSAWSARWRWSTRRAVWWAVTWAAITFKRDVSTSRCSSFCFFLERAFQGLLLNQRSVNTLINILGGSRRFDQTERLLWLFYWLFLLPFYCFFHIEFRLLSVLWLWR